LDDDEKATRALESALADETHAKLLARLAAQKFDGTSSELSASIVEFYSDQTWPIETKGDPARCAAALADLSELRAVVLSTVSEQPAPLAN
jgi:hypothetical protein